jgi:CubicO group peptidase (beta-lactamase class C family)
MNSPTLAIALGVLLGTAAGCATRHAGEPVATRTPTDQRLASVRSRVMGDVDRGVLKSVAIGVIHRDAIVWAEAFGVADAEAGIPATVETPYGIASLGKALTAAAAMTLVEAGKLDLDASVADILGPDAVEIYAGARAPTVRELLNMTSGVPHGAVTYTDAPGAEEADVLDAQSIVVFPAGSTFHYSNFSMALVERVIARASGQRYESYLEEALFRPLGIANALIEPASPSAAARYDKDGVRLPSLTPYPKSSRQISASLSDLLKVAALFLKAPIPGGRSPLSEASIDRMQSEVSSANGAFMALGIGRIGAAGAAPWLITNGNDMGVQSSMIVFPEHHLAAVVLTNTSGDQADRVALSTIDAIVPGFRERAMGEIAAIEGRSMPFRPDPRWIATWSGVVSGSRGDIPMSMLIAESGTITIGFDGGPPQRAEGVSIRDGLLTGSFKGVLPLLEVPSGPHRIEFSLIVEDAALKGFVLANFRTARGKFEIPAPLVLSRGGVQAFNR